MLDDLVLGASGTSTLDVGGTVALQGERIFAHCAPPDILDGAGALAVDALNLVLADDDVLEGGTVLEDEDSVGVTALSLTSAADTTAIGLEATVEGAGDGLSRLVGDGALGGRDGEGCARSEDMTVGGAGVSNTSGSEADGGGDGEDAGEELHFYDGSWCSNKFGLEI